MKFRDLLEKSELHLSDFPSKFGEIEVHDISDDTRNLDENTIFCITKESRAWLASWTPAKYAFILTEKDDQVQKWAWTHPHARLVFCSDISRALGLLASALFGHPSRSLRITGVTGTNGKTTITQMLDWIWKSRQIYSGTIGTLGARWTAKAGACKIQTGYTTPRAPQLHRILAQMLNDGVEQVAIEVSSEALDLGRLEGCHFSHAIFSNLSQDHLDHHQNMEAYYQAKKKLFSGCAKAGSKMTIHTADPWGARLAREIRQEFTDAQIREVAEMLDVSLQANVEFNIINASLAIWSVSETAIPDPFAVACLARMPQIQGRFELVFARDDPFKEIQKSQVFGVVDYAHSPDALKNILSAVQKMDQYSVVCVFGCGGDRDKAKRPLMGQIACQKSDVVIVCDDNPRNEDAWAIREQIIAGMPANMNTIIEIGDRRAAIRHAVKLAFQSKKFTAIVLAGKGHENFQIIGKKRAEFSDVKELQMALDEFNASL